MELLLTLASNSCIKFYDFKSTLLTHYVKLKLMVFVWNWHSVCLFCMYFVDSVCYMYTCVWRTSRCKDFTYSFEACNMQAWSRGRKCIFMANGWLQENWISQHNSSVQWISQVCLVIFFNACCWFCCLIIEFIHCFNIVSLGHRSVSFSVLVFCNHLI